MIEAWLAVERELEALAEESGIDLAERKWTAPALAEELVKLDLIEASALAAVIAELRDARNVAAHARPYTVDRDEVVDYVKLAGRVRSVLRIARRSNAAAQEGRTSYDLLVYYDMSDSTPRTGGTIPRGATRLKNGSPRRSARIATSSPSGQGFTRVGSPSFWRTEVARWLSFRRCSTSLA